MSDDSKKKDDILDLDLDEMEKVLEDQELQDLIMQIKLMKSYGFRMSWSRIGTRLVAIYKKALTQEHGPEAFADFMHGVLGKETN